MDRKVYLAARLRPMTPRELSMGGKNCVIIDGGCTTIVNPDTGDAKVGNQKYWENGSIPFEKNSSLVWDRIEQVPGRHKDGSAYEKILPHSEEFFVVSCFARNTHVANVELQK
jgi:hypothetical protein